MIRFTSLIESLLIESSILDNFVSRYVGEGRIESNDRLQGKDKIRPIIWEEILKVCANNTGRCLFLGKAVLYGWIDSSKNVQFEDIYKFESYFAAHGKRPQEYGDLKDLGKIKTEEDFYKFIATSIGIMDKEVLKKQQKQEGYIPNSDIDKLKAQGIEYLGMSEGYQVFHIPSSLKGNEKAWTTYKNILGKSSGGTISICTIGSFEHFNTYTTKGPLFLMYNFNDNLAPYQINYEGNEFKDRLNKDLLN